VEEGGGGGFWICEAVGARDERIEYVRCMVLSEEFDLLVDILVTDGCLFEHS